ncbi:MAG TPA: sialate O-acetylesterase [Planctomycetota bacterium]|nr:sialate O-acetylesterase [Planctomycetota bacterium]
MHARGVALLILLVAASSGAAREPRAGLRVHGLFGDGMVLQRDRACPVWGSAQPGDRISVAIAGQTKTARAGADGRWSVRLDALSSGGPHELNVSGPESVTFRDVRVGEVWVAAGGTNMEFPLKDSKVSQTQSDENAIAQVRFFLAPKGSADDPVTDLGGSWKSARSEAAAEFSAVAYYFAREIQRVLQVPVGVLQAAADESRADQWMSKRALRSCRGGRGIAALYAMQMGNYEAVLAMYQGSVQKAEEARKNGTPVPPLLHRPARPDPICDQYNARIAPMMPYAIRGAIYYQGEAELYRSFTYESVFPALIQGWREDWGQGELPFGYVQMANYGVRPDAGADSMWAQFRESQRRTLSTPNTGMAVAIDLGESDSIRPRNKEDVGLRLALWAQARVYGRPLVYTGPEFDSMRVESDRVRILFKNVGGGLKADGRLRGFRISGDFRMFVNADAEIHGDTVLVSSPEVRWPAAVRYGWADNPDCNLTNKEGLPATPFRTDSW